MATTEEMCTPYRVSTITANGCIGMMVALEQFFQGVHIVDAMDPTAIGFTWVELEGQHRGEYIKKRRYTRKNVFSNQVTVLYRFRDGYMPNVKIFRNGNIQMTGIKSHDDGRALVGVVADEIARITDQKACPANQTFVVRMINGDFVVPFCIRRKELHQMLMDDFHNTCCYQPENHPGVKLQYFWKNQDGICRCAPACMGKGHNGECKKVTVLIFQSGKILITGATSLEQVTAAYAFICRVLIEHMDRIKWTPPVLPPQLIA